jgi:eukaryotic-like serine/threonine-protein kinase
MAENPGPRRDLFGDLAVAKGYLTWAKVRDCLKRQGVYKQRGIPLRIGEIAVELGILSQAQVNEILATQAERRKASGTGTRATADLYANDFDESGEPFTLGRYRLEKRLGGVMGIVYRGIDEQTGCAVALKVLPKNLAHEPSFVERFKREVKATIMLLHPNIVRIYDAGTEGGVFYMATEFIEGETLNQRLRREGRLDEKLSLWLVREVAKGLAHAHARNVLHRDVKPENVMLSNKGEVKLTDLGLAKFLQDEQRITADGIAVGTPHYISPEQARALKETDHRSDLYSLGVTLFQIVTGSLPYEGDNGAEVMKRHVFEATPDPRSIKLDLNPAIADMIVKLMAKDPRQRYQTADELVKRLDQLLLDYKPADLN